MKGYLIPHPAPHLLLPPCPKPLMRFIMTISHRLRNIPSCPHPTPYLRPLLQPQLLLPTFPKPIHPIPPFSRPDHLNPPMDHHPAGRRNEALESVWLVAQCDDVSQHRGSRQPKRVWERVGDGIVCPAVEIRPVRFAVGRRSGRDCA